MVRVEGRAASLGHRGSAEGGTLETAEHGAERVSWSLLTVDDRR